MGGACVPHDLRGALSGGEPACGDPVALLHAPSGHHAHAPDPLTLPALQRPRRHSSHVVKLLGACLEDKNRLALIMELCEGGNLAQRIYSPSKRRLDTLEVRGLGSLGRGWRGRGLLLGTPWQRRIGG
jgi:hypothetical protein